MESAAPVLDPAPSAQRDNRHRRRRRSTTIGLIGIVVAFLGIGWLHALEQPPFIAPDETAHLGYAQDVASLSLPEIAKEPVVPETATQWRAERQSAKDERYRDVWVANHPPLFYAAVAPLVWVSRAVDAPDGGLILLRFANVTFAAAGVVFTFLLAEELTDGNRRSALAAAAIVALVPHAHAVFSQALNDGLAFACATGVVWAGVRAIRRDDARFRSNLVWLGALAALCFGARASTMLLAVVVVSTVALYWLLRPGTTWAIRRHQAMETLVVGLAPAAVLFGWFYVRNIALYGDIGASHYLLERFDRHRRGSIFDMVRWGELWGYVYQGLFSPSTAARHLPRFTNVLTLFATVGAATVVVTGRLRRGDAGSPELRWRLLLCLVATATIGLTIAQHVAGGGNAYARYALPAVGVIATLFVLGADRLVPRWGPIALLSIIGWWTISNLPVGVDPSARRRRDHGALPPLSLRELPLNDAWRTAAGILIVSGVAIAGVAVVMSCRRTSVDVTSTDGE